MFMENHQQKMIFSDWWFGAWILFCILYMGCHPNPIDELILFKMVFQPPSSFSCRLPVRFFPAYSSGPFSLFPVFFPLPDSGNQSTRSRGVAEQVPGTGYRGVTVSSNPWRWKTELLEGTYRDIPWEKSWWSYWILVEECSKAIGNIQNNGTSWDSIG
jgi:hypothetical protein